MCQSQQLVTWDSDSSVTFADVVWTVCQMHGIQENKNPGLIENVLFSLELELEHINIYVRLNCQ